MFEDIFEEMKKMQERMDKMFNSFMTNDVLLPETNKKNKKSKALMNPLSDIIETKNQIKAVLDIPGVDKKDIIIETTPNGIKVIAEKEIEKKSKKKDFKRFERRYTGYSRFFSLPETADKDNISATYKNGVLELLIPKKKTKKKESKKIKIK